VSDEYLKRAHARGNERLSVLNRGTNEYPRWGSGEMEVTAVEALDAGGQPTHVFRTGEACSIRLRWKAHADCAAPVFGLGLYRSDGTYVNGSNHHWREEPIAIEAVGAGEEGEVWMNTDQLQLLQGQYYLTSFLYDHSKASPTAIDHREHALTIEVLDAKNHQHGMLFLNSRWKVTRRGPGAGQERTQESRR
jgi:hypothetical protein